MSGKIISVQGTPVKSDGVTAVKQTITFLNEEGRRMVYSAVLNEVELRLVIKEIEQTGHINFV